MGCFGLVWAVSDGYIQSSETHYRSIVAFIYFLLNIWHIRVDKKAFFFPFLNQLSLSL